MVKKLIITSLAVLIIASGIMSAALAGQEDKQIRLINFINGNLGDKSFFDSANRGLSRAEKEFGLDARTVEAGNNSSRWRSVLDNATSRGDYDILVAGTFDMTSIIQNESLKHPDKKIIFYDGSVNYSAANYSNVYSILFKQNEGSYLVGVYAALMSRSGIIGAIGGMDNPTINDFIAGYEQGARSARPNITVITRYGGSFDNITAGKKIAREIYGQGADIIFQISGAMGQGVFQAALEEGKYAIGVDSDQASIINQTSPEEARVILTSMMKNVDNSLYRAIKLYLEGSLPFGHSERLGIREGGVGLARNKIYNESTPADIKAKVDAVEMELRG